MVLTGKRVENVEARICCCLCVGAYGKVLKDSARSAFSYQDICCQR